MAAVLLPLAVALLVVILTALYLALEHLLLRPQQLLKRLKVQGVPGYPFRLLWGQIPEIRAVEKQRSVDPSLAAATWASQFLINGCEKYGKAWSWSLAFLPRVTITDPAMIRMAHVMKKDSFVKPAMIKKVRILGNGLVSSDGELWARQRRLITPAFHMVELRRLYPTMIARTQQVLAKWKAAVTELPGKVLAMDREFSDLTLNILCATAFGMDLEESVEKRIRDAFDQYMLSTNKNRLYLVFPLISLLPTEANRVMRRSDQDLRRLVKQIVYNRVKDLKKSRHRENPTTTDGGVNGNGVTTGEERKTVDLLQLMLQSTDGIQQQAGGTGSEKGIRGSVMSEQQLMDECLTFLLAGHETTAVTLTWTVMLLSKHSEWQDKARDEVQKLGISLESPPDQDALSQLKIVTWILQEVLRLYPPASALTRTAIEDTKLSDSLTIPKGCDVIVPIEALHQCTEFWGPDAKEFNPQRFANGTAQAASEPGAYIPFGLGPRVCIGQNFAMMEGKLILSLFLSTFKWSTAESYRHHPAITLTSKPKHGMPVVLVPVEQQKS